MTRSVLYRYVDAELLDRLEHRPLQPRDLVLGNLAGGHKSPLAGFAVEFAGHREYVPGDEPKHVDWRVYFKREKLFIKQYELETNFVCHLVLDVSASMTYGEGDQQKLQAAIRLLTSLAYRMVLQRDKVALYLAGERLLPMLSPSNTMPHLVQLAQQLESLQVQPLARLGTDLAELADVCGRRAIVMVFSDGLGDHVSLERGIQRLRFQRNEVVLFQVVHGDECTFPFVGDFEFEGLEGDLTLLGNGEDMRQAYLQAWAEHQRGLTDLCHRNGAELVTIRTDQSLARQVTLYLDQRHR